MTEARPTEGRQPERQPERESEPKSEREPECERRAGGDDAGSGRGRSGRTGGGGERDAAPSDRALSLYLEGLLGPRAVERVEAAVAKDAAVRARLAALREVLAEPVALPPLELPAGLLDGVLARLEGEGLVDAGLPGAEALDDRGAGAGADRGTGVGGAGGAGGAAGVASTLGTAPPRGLLDRTMARLEAEGLVEPADAGSARGGRGGRGARQADRPAASPAARRLPGGASWLRLAAAFLLTAAGAAASGYAVRGERVRVVHEVADAAPARVERVEVRVPVEVERVVRVEVPVERVVEVPVERVVEVPVERVVERIVRVEVPVERVVERLVPVPAPAEALALAVTAARGAEVWRGASGEWEPLAAGSALVAGDLVRGASSAAAFEVGGRRLRLGTGEFVVRGGSIDPLPDASGGLAASARSGSGSGSGSAGASAGASAGTPAPASGTAEDEVAGLLALLDSGSPDERFTARRALEALWRERADPGPGTLVTLASAIGTRPSDAGGPPRDAAAWRGWWERVK